MREEPIPEEPMLESHRRLARLGRGEYGLLRQLADDGLVDLEPIEALLNQSVTDRLNLARQYLAFAQSIALDSEFHGRQVISRSYYAMHHAARALILHTTRQDVTSHEGVIRQIRRHLGAPEADSLANCLNLRNSVEYEVYPRMNVIALAQEASNAAEQFIVACEAHLVGRE